jgi:hypothetical protein
MAGGQFINYGGKKPPLDQAGRRRDLKIKDQHGREYHVVYDRLAQAPILCYPQFHAPWIPDIAVLNNSFVCNESGMPERVFLDYDHLIAENRREWSRYFDDLQQIGSKMPGVDHTKAYAAATTGDWDNVPRALLMEVGRPPMPEDFPKACKAENKWALGLSNVVPVWAEPIIGLRELFKANADRPVLDAELDKYREVEEEHDPDAVNGHKQPISSKKGKKAHAGVTEE